MFKKAMIVILTLALLLAASGCSLYEGEISDLFQPPRLGEEQQALLDALNSGKVRAAGLDVWAEEPSKNHELYSHPMVSCTPHIGAATVEAQKRIGMEIVDIISKM